MGSFNMTCGVSGLPINWRTPCRVFFLVPHGHLDFKYAAVWEPVNIIPLKGTYEDCGRLEDLDLSPAFHLEHPRMLAKAQEFSEEQRKDYWQIFEKFPDDPGALYQLCEREILQLKTPHGTKEAMPFYVREDVYQRVLERSRKAKNFRGPYLDRCEEMIWARFRKRELDDETMRLYGDQATEEDKVRRRELIGESVKIEHKDNGRGTHQGNMLLIESWEKIQKDPELKASLKEAMLEFELFAGGIEALNIAWQPKTRKGQDDDYRYHAKWHREIAKLADAAQKRWDEEL
jgi:hypothetical protein